MPIAHDKSDVAHDTDNSKTPLVVGTTTTMNAAIELPENSRIVQPSYLEKNTGKVRYELI